MYVCVCMCVLVCYIIICIVCTQEKAKPGNREKRTVGFRAHVSYASFDDCDGRVLLCTWKGILKTNLMFYF